MDDWFGGEEVGLGSEWSVPWSDLMMTMFVLFVVLFAYKAAESEIRPVPEPIEPAPLPPPIVAGPPAVESGAALEVYRESLRAARESATDGIRVVLEDDTSVRVTLGGPMFFDLGSAELREGTMRFLDRVAPLLGKSDRPVQVIGHTDSFPISSERYPTNWELSAARAAAVARYLIRAGRLEPARFTVVGHSMFRPAAPNTSLQFKALNRRVEILIAGVSG